MTLQQQIQIKVNTTQNWNRGAIIEELVMAFWALAIGIDLGDFSRDFSCFVV